MMKKLAFVLIALLCFLLIGCKEKQVNEKSSDMSVDNKVNLESKQDLEETNQEQEVGLGENCEGNIELLEYKEEIKNDITLCYESLDVNDYSIDIWNEIKNLYYSSLNQINEQNSKEYLYEEKNRIICQIRSFSPKSLTYGYILKSFDLEDKKVYWKGTIDDVFPDNLIIVVLKKPINYIELSVESFELENAVSIKYSGGVTPPDYMFKKEYEYLLKDFRQIIFIRLEPLGKEKVIEAIRKLEQLEFVKSAQPDVALGPVE